MDASLRSRVPMLKLFAIKKRSADIYSGSSWSIAALRPRMSFEMPRGLYTHAVFHLCPIPGSPGALDLLLHRLGRLNGRV
jgi:hypothetical protein